MRMVLPTSTPDVDLVSDVTLVGPPAAGQAPGGKPARRPARTANARLWVVFAARLRPRGE